jgi:AmmeMemoRadiSam system protein B
MIRPPAVAGSFYPSDARELAQAIDKYSAASANAPPKTHAIACVVPHAGYMYSGHVAGAVYSEMEIPHRCILLGPRHYPQGQPLAILTKGAWQMPFGEAQIDEALAAELALECPRLREDSVAHAREHSLEVQLPFLQHLAPRFQFVPVVLSSDRFAALEDLGHAVALVIARANAQAAAEPDRVLLLASTDMNHYENDAVTRLKDARAVERILALDARGLYDTVRNEEITMCGYAATAAMLVAARELGAKQARLVRYATSADINGDHSRVVGYAGLIIC